MSKHGTKRRGLRALVVILIIIGCLGVIAGSFALANVVSKSGMKKYVDGFEKIEYASQLTPVLEDGYWTFTTDNDLKVLQFTDVHIGGGTLSKNKDMWALNAVATMIKAEKPDLVVVTGDIAYPVPFSSGSFNNLVPTELFAEMMEKLGVYWTFVFGNHDTEMYSYYSRKELTEYYEKKIDNGDFKYCLFQRGNASEELGYGNTLINVKNSAGVTTQSLVLLDSHSYIDHDYFGMLWKYDNLHESQVEWYAGEMDKIKEKNAAKGYDQYAKNLAFFHIPLVEYRDAYKYLLENDEDETAKWFHKNDGRVESDKTKNGVRTYSVYCGYNEDSFFEEGQTHGLQGVFCGHDHYNNFSIDYKGVRLTYGYSVDYLAYPGIWKERIQRGCTIITCSPDGSFDMEYSNYYNEKYEAVNKLAGDKNY